MPAPQPGAAAWRARALCGECRFVLAVLSVLRVQSSVITG